MNNKILIFLPDGVGLRNFAFTSFYKEISKDNEVVFLNNTVFPLNYNLGINEIKTRNLKTHFLTDLLKSAKNHIELLQSFKKYNDKAYLYYIFPRKNKTYKQFIKNSIIDFYINFFNSKKGVLKIIQKINRLERTTPSYKSSLKLLKKENPNFLFCTNQRPILALAVMLAAKDLGIPTAVFIFSWDNLPKGMLVVEADYYFVWSEHMKNELLYYYPHILEKQIKITGSPQFEGHFQREDKEDKLKFYKKYKLDLSKKYICFSGDDITTSPYDQYYLEDLAQVVTKMNKERDDGLRIIYRKCPVDFSNRHLEIVKKYTNLITCIDPLWDNLGNGWNTVMPKETDSKLLSDTIRYSELVVNVGSSMVFDALCHNTPCAYINYNSESGDVLKWNIEKIYEYIHFKSMPSKEVVLWVNKKEDYRRIIKDVLNNDYSLSETKKWFDLITLFPQNKASENIVNEINKIMS